MQKMLIFIHKEAIMSASLIGWIVSLAFVAMIVIGFFIGMWRGLKHSTINLLISVVGVIIAFFITPLITDAILGIPVPLNGKEVPLKEIALELFMQNPDMATLAEKNANLQVFMRNLPKAVVGAILFMLVVAVIEGIFYIVYKILAKTAFKLKEDEKKRKISGGIVGAVKTFIIVLISFMPFSALIGVANNCLNKGDYGIAPATTEVATLVEGEEIKPSGRGFIADAMPEVVLTTVDGLENNLLTKLSGLFGLDDALFDYYATFEVAGEKVVVRKEVENIYNVVDISMQLSKVDSTYSFENFDYKKIAKEIDDFSQSAMFKNVLADTLGELIMNYEDYSIIANSQIAQEYADVLDSLSAGIYAYTQAGGSVGDYFNDDISKIIDVSTMLGESGAIDEIASLETADAGKALGVLTSDEYYQTFKTGVDKLFEMNIVRDAIDKIANKFIPQISPDVDAIGVSTDDWTTADWQSLSNSVSSILKNYSAVADKISILDVLNDATILLDKQENYDIEGILAELGALVDQARGVNLLQTADDKPIIDKLLTKYNMALPTNPVIKNNGQTITITTYGGTDGLFDFIAPSLVEIRDNDIYDLVTSEGSVNDKMTSLAEVVSIDGNEKLLSEIILPLYQVEPTKTLIVNQLTSGLNSSLIDFSQLSNYEEWKTDLDYISTILKTLNSKKATVEGNEKTYLQLVLEGKFADVVDNLKSNEIDAVIKPVFYAKSTSAVRASILSTIESDLKTITGDNSLTLSATGVTFEKDAFEDQTQEVCNVLKEILPLKEGFADIQTIDKEALGKMLNTMKGNAYRVELTESQEEKFTEAGIFKGSLISLMAKLKVEYATEVALLESQPDMLESELGVRSLAEENYVRIDFSLLMALLDTMS